MESSKRHRSKGRRSDSNNDDAPPRRKRSTHNKSAKKKKKQQFLDSNSESESEDDAPPPKKKRKFGSKYIEGECTARANVNAFVRTAVHDIHPHTTPRGRFMYWDPKVPTSYCTVIYRCVCINHPIITSQGKGCLRRHVL